jgi:hypothetical protein
MLNGGGNMHGACSAYLIDVYVKMLSPKGMVQIC